jgi:hypothetical protein
MVMVAAPGSIGMCLFVKFYVAHCVCSSSVSLLLVFIHALIYYQWVCLNLWYMIVGLSDSFVTVSVFMRWFEWYRSH